MSETTRRGFMENAAMAAPVAAIVGVTAGLAQAKDAPSRRRVIGGSPSAAYSRATVFDKMVYPAGVVGRSPDSGELPGGFEAECTQTLENLKASVEAAGASMANVLKCTCFLTDVADFAMFNEIFMRYFPSQPPARSTVVVKELVVKGARIELDCVACLAS